MVTEIRRGIWETTGLFTEPVSPGWIAITCESRAMAEWLGAAIAPENVEVRVEDDRVILPAGPRFRLEHEVKSIITVVAKTHHYARAHGRIAMTPEATGRHGFRCTCCGLEVQVSRRQAEAGRDTTCPLDGAPMDRRGPVTIGSLPSFSGPVRVGVEGSRDEATALIDALRRRYGRRRAVVASAAGVSEVNDHAVELILVGPDDGAPGLGPGVVDGTIVLGAGPGLEEETRRRGGQHPVVFVDPARPEGVDLVVSWLQREMGLDPWRGRRP
jgi:hypothetical protein